MSDGTQQLPETSRNALIRIADELRDGFTGCFEVQCNQGGVVGLKEVRVVPPDDLRDERETQHP